MAAVEVDLFPTIQALLRGTGGITLRDVEAALDKGASPDTWRGPLSPVRCAVQARNTRLLSLLLRKGASTSLKDAKGVTPLHVATFDGKTDIVRVLLDAHADANVKDRHGQTPLFFAPSRQICELLLVARADANVTNHKKQSPLHLAAHAGLIDALSCIAEVTDKKILEAKDHRGRTPLHYAASSRIKSTAQVLKHGVDSISRHRLSRPRTSSKDGKDSSRDRAPRATSAPAPGGGAAGARKVEAVAVTGSAHVAESAVHGDEETDARSSTPTGSVAGAVAGAVISAAAAEEGVEVEAAAAAGGERGPALSPTAAKAAAARAAVPAIQLSPNMDHSTSEPVQRAIDSVAVAEEPSMAASSSLDPAMPRPPSSSRASSEASMGSLKSGAEPSKVVQEERDGCLFWDVTLTKATKEDKYGFVQANGRVEFETRLKAGTITKVMEHEEQAEQGADSRDPLHRDQPALLPGPDALIVRRIHPGGLMQRWNQKHKDSVICPQDRICNVNGINTVEAMQMEFRSRRRVVMRMMRYPERFIVILTKTGPDKRLGFRFERPQKGGHLQEVRISEVMEEGLLADHNKHQVALGNWHYVVLPDMRVEAANRATGDALRIAEELKRSPQVTLTIRRAEQAMLSQQQVRARLSLLTGRLDANGQSSQRLAQLAQLARAQQSMPSSDDPEKQRNLAQVAKLAAMYQQRQMQLQQRQKQAALHKEREGHGSSGEEEAPPPGPPEEEPPGEAQGDEAGYGSAGEPASAESAASGPEPQEPVERPAPEEKPQPSETPPS